MSDTPISPSFKYNGTEISIEFGYKEVMGEFKKKGLDLFALFEGDETIMTIMANDRVMLQIWYHYVSPYAQSEEAAIENLKPHELHSFKEAFWQQVINFTQPQMRPLAVEMWKKLKERLKSPEKILKDSSSDSSEKPE